MDDRTNEMCVEWAQVLERLIQLTADLDVPESIKRSERLIIAAAIIAAAAKQHVTIVNG
jgi:hypothetical protein